MRLAVIVALVAHAAFAGAAPATHRPGALVLVIDRSESMQGRRLAAVKAAAIATARALAPDDQIAVIAFDAEAQVYVPLQRAGDVARFTKQVSRLSTGGSARYAPALRATLALLAPVKLARKHVIWISDSVAPDDGLAELVGKLQDAGVTLDTIGLGYADDERDVGVLLQLMAERTDGSYTFTDDTSWLPKLVAAQAVAALRRDD